MISSRRFRPRFSFASGKLVVLAVAIIASAGLAAACIPWQVVRPSGPAPLRYRDEVFGNYTLTSNLQYGSAPGLDGSPVALKLDMYEPANDSVAARPAIVWVHGGGYVGGDKAAGPAVIMAPLYAKLGYVFVSIDYRLLTAHGCNATNGVAADCYAAAVAAIHDAQAAVRWLRANAAQYRIDPDRIGIGGESAGAITATGVGIYADQPGDSGNPGYASNVQGWVSISGGVPNGILVDSSDAPGFLFSGTADTTVPYIWSVQTADAMAAAGVPVVFRSLPDAGHVPWLRYGDVFEEQSENFFYKYLDLAGAAR